MESLRKLDRKGYVRIYKTGHEYSKTRNGWIYEHRAIVEDFIKRKLEKGWCVHHLDENKENNKISNLMIFKSHKEHSAFHNKVRRLGLTNPIKRQIRDRWKEFI